MNTTEFLSETNDLLDNDRSLKFSDAMLIRTANRQMRGLFRTLVQANKEYSNFSLALYATGAVQLMQDIWEYRLPTWVTHVAKVYRIDSMPTTTPTTFSPYQWQGGTTSQRGSVIEKWVANSRERYWSWEGTQTLRLNRSTTSENLLLEVAVRPPVMFKATLSQAGADASHFYLPAALTYGDPELEEGAFVNAEIICTGTGNTNGLNYGNQRRVIYSNAATIVLGSRLHELTFEAPWAETPAENDIFESIVPIPDEHTRLLVLKTAQAAFGRKPNIDAARIISSEMADEMGKFMAYATAPRDKQGPSYIRHSLRTRPAYDPDRPFWGWDYR